MRIPAITDAPDVLDAGVVIMRTSGIVQLSDWREYKDMHIGHIKEIWRYPVKSLGGEIIKEATLDDFDIMMKT